ncbi:hypothetical protein BJI47_14455 [Rhodococcus sp. 1168]|nr:hypothetical protein BJI47_14455 [Rhodococcus sp. 1168]
MEMIISALASHTPPKNRCTGRGGVAVVDTLIASPRKKSALIDPYPCPDRAQVASTSTALVQRKWREGDQFS